MGEVVQLRRAAPLGDLRTAAPYAAAIILVGAAALAASLMEHLAGPVPNLSLVFVLPVLMVALRYGWRPALLAATAAVLAFDVFFVEPRYSLTVASPADVWAISLLLTVAAMSSSVGAQARRQRLSAQAAAAHAQALRRLADSVIRGDPTKTVLQVGAETLSALCGSSAVVVRSQGGELNVVGATIGAQLSAVDMEAAAWALAEGRVVRAQEFPFDGSTFDMWPVDERFGESLLLAVANESGDAGRVAERTDEVRLVAAYLAAAARAAPALIA